jgi:hypothetical protein
VDQMTTKGKRAAETLKNPKAAEEPTRAWTAMPRAVTEKNPPIAIDRREGDRRRQDVATILGLDATDDRDRAIDATRHGIVRNTTDSNRTDGGRVPIVDVDSTTDDVR